MTVSTATLRTIGTLATGMLGLGLLAACAPAPEPTPTPTAAFATDEEAFAAAEKTYTEYFEAGKARDKGQDSPDPQDFLIGLSLEADIDAQRWLKQNKITATGDVELLSFTPEQHSVSADRTKLAAIVCVDITKNRVLDAKGRDITPAGRPSIVGSRAEMVWVDDTYLISNETEADDGSCS